jgi:RND family efflux transporter MFP subunit
MRPHATQSIVWQHRLRHRAFAGALTLLLLTGCDTKRQTPPAPVAQDPAPVAQDPPRPSAPDPTSAGLPAASANPREYTTSGPLVVEQQANVSAERDGRVTTVKVDLGDHVHRGEVLALLDDRALQADYSAKEAHLKSLEAMLREWQAEQRGCEADMRRSDSLFASKIISEEEVEHVRSKLEQTIAEVARNKLEVEAAESDLRAAQIGLEATRVFSPLNGVVGRRTVRTAQEVKKGDPLFWVTAEGPLHVVFTVPESAMTAFHRGARLELASAALPGLRQPATVVRVSPVVDPASGSIEVNALVEHPSAELKPGMSMQVRLAPQ